jgi:hypothetical protein
MKRCTALAPLTCLSTRCDWRTESTSVCLANGTEAIT